ncbi:hypothetical protein HMPREF1317_0353 [Schaalia georgiae F0490]|uniref:Uncharacterized protein n=1 Tax=Schaalia georgiae F0490 TaxID=1125717 RepID=J0N8D7_9ACTO|nr:hypothetical protein HMPREF1317_0353 [Schaalia georgiae F0490]
MVVRHKCADGALPVPRSGGARTPEYLHICAMWVSDSFKTVLEVHYCGQHRGTGASYSHLKGTSGENHSH